MHALPCDPGGRAILKILSNPPEASMTRRKKKGHGPAILDIPAIFEGPQGKSISN